MWIDGSRKSPIYLCHLVTNGTIIMLDKFLIELKEFEESLEASKVCAPSKELGPKIKNFTFKHNTKLNQLVCSCAIVLLDDLGQLRRDRIVEMREHGYELYPLEVTDDGWYGGILLTPHGKIYFD